jgi:hypothetical protein
MIYVYECIIISILYTKTLISWAVTVALFNFGQYTHGLSGADG